MTISCVGLATTPRRSGVVDTGGCHGNELSLDLCMRFTRPSIAPLRRGFSLSTTPPVAGSPFFSALGQP
jgi:hypothetical protein